MYNVNPDTGVRYGVISVNSLNQDLVQELWYGAGARDLSYEAAYNEAKREAAARWQELHDEAEIAANETDPNMPEGDFDRFIEKWFEDRGHESDEEMFIERELEAFSDMCQIEEPEIEGECDGVKYRISWLGGAPLLWVIEGPVGFAHRLCSPCVPNAADLDGGFEPTNIPVNEIHRDHDGYLCYVVPQDWLSEVEA